MKNSTSTDGYRAAGPELAEEARYATSYRLRLSHPLWHRDTYTKWQASPDFTTAIKKAEGLGVTATVESHNDKTVATEGVAESPAEAAQPSTSK